MRMVLLALALAASCGHAEEVVVVGHVTQIVLLPEGHVRCPPACPSTTDSICVSNRCGCGEATIKVREVVTGRVRSSVFVAPYRLGEWCAAGFPLTGEMVLVRTLDGDSRWSPAEVASSGEIFFDVDAFDVIAGVRASDLSVDGKHVSLSALRKAAGL